MKKILTLAGLLFYFSLGNIAFAATGTIQTQADYNAHADGVFLYSTSSGNYYSYKSEASDATSDDVMVSTASDSYLYIGSNSPFNNILWDVTTSSSSTRTCFTTLKCQHYSLEYYNGLTDSWESLSYTDNTNNLKKIGQNSFEFDLPEAWLDEDNNRLIITESVIPDGDMTQGYFIRLKTKSDVSVPKTVYVAEIVVKSYNVNLLITDELGTAITDLEESEMEVSGGSSNDLAGFMNIGDGVYKLALDTEQSDNNYDLEVQRKGYVYTSVSTGEMSTSNTDLWAILDFPHRIDIEDENGDELIPDSVTVSGETCTLEDASAYCPVDPMDDGDSASIIARAIITVDGEESSVYLSEDRDAYSDPQVLTTATIDTTEDSSSSSDSSDSSSDSSDSGSSSSSSSTATLTVNVENEKGEEMKSLSQSNFNISGGSDNTIYSFTNNADGTYKLSLETGSNYSIKTSYDGYVTETYSTGEFTTSGYSKSVLLKYGYKLKVEDATGDNLKDASIKTGNGLNISCTYISGGYYGCAVPLSDTGIDYRVSLFGYFTFNGHFDTDRDDATDSQEIDEVVLTEKITLKSSSGESVEEDCTDPFSDTYGHWAEGYIEELYCRGVVSGRSEDTFAPNENITRAEFLKIALLDFSHEVEGSDDEDFSDVDSGDWYYEYVSYASAEGYIEGYSDGTFKPNDYINRAEALTILIRIAGGETSEVSGEMNFSDVSEDDWFAAVVSTAYDAEITEGYSDGTFRPGNNISRAEVAAIAVRAFEAF